MTFQAESIEKFLSLLFCEKTTFSPVDLHILDQDFALQTTDYASVHVNLSMQIKEGMNS